MRQALTVWDRLENWGRWHRSGDPLHIARTQKEFDAGAPAAPPSKLPAYDLYSPYRTAKEEGGEVPPLDPPRDPIDARDAVYFDNIYRVGIHFRHRPTLYKRFYRLIPLDKLYVDFAVRAVSDALLCDRIPRDGWCPCYEDEYEPDLTEFHAKRVMYGGRKYG